MRARAFALLCALWLACARAAAYTVDCNHEYADCDELSKLANEDEDIQRPRPTSAAHIFVTPQPQLPLRTTPKISQSTTSTSTTTEAVSIEDPAKRPRLLNLSTEDLQSFANALHNQSAETRKSMIDLSDVNLDEDEDEEHPKIDMNVPFSPLLASMVEKEEKEEKEEETCLVNGIIYKVGEKLDRACEETCECLAGGHLDCVPRCRHPYIRRGKRLEDPLCFLSPVDECCSIETCPDADGHGHQSKLEGCRYLNNTYAVGQKWYVGCEQACTCEKNNMVTCTSRCTKPPSSDKCINVQDPKDACCEVQVCDVSQDVHEIPENITSTTTTTTTTEKAQPIEVVIEVGSEESTTNPKVPQATRPLVLREPIGSVTVLQNNSVQVNLIHPNNSQDPIHLLLSSDGGQTFEGIQLKYSNLLLNLGSGKDYVLKTRETGTKFNFTITMSDDEEKNVSKIGCTQDEKFYEVGEEFRIGCIELCECTGNETRECAPLHCPNHVGLELVSRGCVLWARDPPPQPPECCPRTARCLSDGTCHYREQSIPNWSEVPIALTGCEERCFCENGELDCQQVCSPLPALPPQSLRCPPLHRPAPVNISDEDCCKEWGCVPNAIDMNDAPPSRMPINHGHIIASNLAVTPQPPLETTFTTVLPQPTVATSTYQKPLTPRNPEINEHKISLGYKNVTYSSENLDDPFFFLHPGRVHPLVSGWHFNEHTQPVNHPKIKVLNLSGNEQPQEESQESQLVQNTIGYLQGNRFTNNVMFSPTNRVSETTTIITRPKTIQSQSYPDPLTDSLFFPSNLNRAHKFHVPTKTFPKNLNTKCGTVPCKQVTVLRTKDILLRPKVKHLEKEPSKVRVIANDPNNYDTVLQKLPDIDHETHLTHTTYGQRLRPNNDKYSMVNMDGLLNQMDIGEGVNRNTGRSSGKGRNALTAGAPMDGQTKPSHPHQPSFLPTLPPNIQFPHDNDDDIGDYDLNNIHHPLSPSEANLPTIPNQPQLPPNYADVNKKLSVISLQADTPTSVKMLFGLPPVLVGLRGSVDLRYTDKSDDDFSRWSSQVFAPADEVLTTSRLEFRLTGLKPSTTYRVRGKLYLANLHVQPESDVYSVRTQDATVEEKRREIDSKLQVVDVNDTSAHVSWRHFNEDELQFIDGIQVRYRPVGTPIYIMTELLHHSRSNADLHDLRPGSKYEASLVLVPPPRTATELHDPASVEFTTSPYVDPYNWTVTIEANSIGSEACSLTWRGVPSPAERWVRVYRAAHACGSGRAREHDAFRLASRDQPPQITLSGLEPDTRCRVWLEMFLTNGKVKTSNVLEVNTKPLDTPEPIDNAIELSSIGGRGGENRGDYYGALVIVGVIAALGAVTSLLLLLIVVRRHRPRSVPITPVPTAPRDSSLPPYDNPAYKIELQQETMDL